MGPPPPPRKLFNQNQIGFWNISSRLTSAASFIEIGLPPFPTSGILSQTMTLINDRTQNVIMHMTTGQY